MIDKKLLPIIFCMSLTNACKNDSKDSTAEKNKISQTQHGGDAQFKTSISIPIYNEQKIASLNSSEFKMTTVFNQILDEKISNTIKFEGVCSKTRQLSSDIPGNYSFDFRLYHPPVEYTDYTSPLIHVKSTLISKIKFDVPINCEVVTLLIKNMDVTPYYQVGGEIKYVNQAESDLLYFGASKQFKVGDTGVAINMTTPSTCKDTCTIFTSDDLVDDKSAILDFKANPQSGTAPLNVVFNGEANFTVTSWQWDFDDDGTVDSNLQNPTYAFQNAGVYSVKLTTIGTKFSKTISKSNIINVTDNTKTDSVDFSASPTEGFAPLTVSFLDKSNFSPTSWQWDFNDDGVVDSTLQNPSYVFNAPGLYPVKLTAINDNVSLNITKTNYINVKNQTTSPLADFAASTTTGTASLTVNFQDKSNFTVNKWEWDFNNDGIVDSNLQNPSYTYDQAGKYTVKLKVSDNSQSASRTKTEYIVVSEQGKVCSTEVLNPFDQHDDANWYRADGWNNGLPFIAGWRQDHVIFEGGFMKLRIDNNTCPGGCSNASYATGHYQTKGDLIQYGRFESRFKTSNVEGTITSLFTYTGPSDGNPWDEIDIEIMGKDPTKMQVNYWTNGVEHPVDIDLGFDSSADFHTYVFEWKPSSITWFVDGVQVHQETGTKGALPTHPSKLMMNYWPSQGWDKAGTFTYNGPSEAVYDYVKYTPYSCL